MKKKTKQVNSKFANAVEGFGINRLAKMTMFLGLCAALVPTSSRADPPYWTKDIVDRVNSPCSCWIGHVVDVGSCASTEHDAAFESSADAKNFVIDWAIRTGNSPNGNVINTGGTWQAGWLQDSTCNTHLIHGNYCPAGLRYSATFAKCAVWIDRYHDKSPPGTCPKAAGTPKFGNPIYPLTGSKRLDIGLGTWFGQAANVTYDTRNRIPDINGLTTLQYLPAASFGPLWQSNFHKRLMTQGSPIAAIQASRGAKVWVSFGKNSGTGYSADADINDRLVDVSGGGWMYYDAVNQAQETYDSSGNLLTVAFATGELLTYIYSSASTPPAIAPTAGLVIGIQDQFGHHVAFNYSVPTGAVLPAIVNMIDTLGQSTNFSYDSVGNLQRINWPDGTSQQLLYENTNLPWALTGRIDESNVRSVSYAYDGAGRAIDTLAAGGVEHFSVNYQTAPNWQITETAGPGNIIYRDHNWVVPQGTSVTQPNGQAITLVASSSLGMPYLSSRDQPAGSGCGASSNALAYDANSNVAWREDFNGHRVCYANDLSRNLEVGRVEGLAAGSSCDTVLAAAAPLPAGSRKVTSAWHPVWRKETKVAEPRLLTTSVYNGQPDPFNGGATAWCAPSNATLPDGGPIVVLCKQVEQATTDMDGSQGFAATLSTTVAPRIQSWTYSQYGQLLTATDPLGHQTVYTYYASTGTDHTMGDLQSVKNAADQLRLYTKYNATGQVLESIDANQVTTSYAYDARQRLTSVSTAGAVVQYAYWPTGLLKQVTLPDASIVAYGYDDAHRLTSVSDGLGNKITYTLDNSGVRVAEDVKDPSGVLSRSLTRVPDALGRVQQIIGQE